MHHGQAFPMLHQGLWVPPLVQCQAVWAVRHWHVWPAPTYHLILASMCIYLHDDTETSQGVMNV